MWVVPLLSCCAYPTRDSRWRRWRRKMSGVKSARQHSTPLVRLVLLLKLQYSAYHERCSSAKSVLKTPLDYKHLNQVNYFGSKGLKKKIVSIHLWIDFLGVTWTQIQGHVTNLIHYEVNLPVLLEENVYSFDWV